MKRKFTLDERENLLSLTMAAYRCIEIQNAAYVLFHHRHDLDEHILTCSFDDLENALEELNKRFAAVKPMFPRKQEQEAA